MLISLKSLQQFKVSAVDGEIGHVVDVLMDDQYWTVRYLAVATGEWLRARQVLLSTRSFRNVDIANKRFGVALTVEEVRHSPLIDTDAPVSRYQERLHSQYYGLPFYWNAGALVGLGLQAGMATPSGLVLLPDEFEPDTHDVHLRSVREVSRYHVIGVGDTLGHISDFFADESSWAVKYIAVDTGSWWSGNKVLIAPRFATGVSWEQQSVQVTMDRSAIERSPAWDGRQKKLDDDFAALLDAHFAIQTPITS